MKSWAALLLIAPFLVGILLAMAFSSFVHWVAGESWRRHPPRGK